MTLDIRQVSKSFGTFQAVDNVSFTVTPGRIFGLLGTNGAGKTTTMRMILDIIRADSGEITWNGVPTMDVPRATFGYLPEERGLYPKMPVDRQLQFIAELYGAGPGDVRTRITEWLDRLGVNENRTRRVEELSKGNQQKIQFLAAILHDPDILIMDEPFSGLDPVNANQMRDAFLEMRNRGKTIIYSTHQLDDAQELSHEVAIIHRGRVLIQGEVGDVRRSMNRQVVKFATAGRERMTWVRDVAGIEMARETEAGLELVVTHDSAAQEVLREAVRRGLTVTQFEISDPSLNDVFLSKVRSASAAASKDRAAAVAEPIPAGGR